MKTVGHRFEPALSFYASAELLRSGARFNEELQRVAGTGSTFIPKGVHRFHSMEDAEAHRIDVSRADWPHVRPASRHGRIFAPGVAG
jgi:hypothetical protein